MNQYHVDGNWQRMMDDSPMLQRLVRLHTGMVVGRILRGPVSTHFTAETYNKGAWQAHGQHDSYDDALRAVVQAAQLVR